MSEEPTVAMQRLHPLTILFAAIPIMRSLILPAVVTGISVARRNPGGALVWIGIAGGVASVIGATAQFIAFRYRLATDSLVIDSGVLQKQHRVIPLASVQNVEVRETALQRLLGVATLAVETATGGREADASFVVLRRETADALRIGILARRAQVAPTAAPEFERAEIPAAEPTVVVTQLAPRDLVVAGATANHAGLIFAALAGALQFVDDLPYQEWAEHLPVNFAFRGFAGILLIGTGVIVFLLVSGWILSIVGSLVGYWDFILTRGDEKLHKSHGLLGRRRATIPLARIQALRCEESILRRPLALASVRVTTAGAATQGHDAGGAETIAPIARASDVPRLVAAVLPSLDYAGIALQPVHAKSRLRAFTQFSVVLLGLSAAVALWRWQLALISLLLLAPAWILAAWQYRHRGWARTGDYVVARSGVMNQVTWVVPVWKLQTVHVRESPFQRRHGLATVVLDTAGGGGHASARDLSRADATLLVQSLRQ